MSIEDPADDPLGAWPGVLRSAIWDQPELAAHAPAALRGTGRTGRGWLMRRALLLADVLGLSLGFFVGEVVHGRDASVPGLGVGGEYLVFLLSLPCWVVVAKLHGLYDKDEARPGHTTTDDVVGVFHLVTIGAWLLFAGTRLLGLAQPDFNSVTVFWLVSIVLVPICRATARSLCRRSSHFAQRTVIVGAGEVGQLIARKLIKHREYGVDLVGFVDAHPRARRGDLPEDLVILGPPEQLPELVRRHDIERVVVSFSNESGRSTLEVVRSLRHLDMQVDIVPRLFEVVGPRVGIHTVEGLPLVGLPPARPTPSSRLLKRAMDVIGAAVMLAATAPLFLFVAMRIRRESPGPVFFRQVRLGGGMREFTALKFRTMKVDTDVAAHREYIRATMSSEAVAGANGMFKLDRSDAVTPTGRWLRKTSLDELPQLLNVLRGDMSLVGPRPCIPYETELFQAHHFDRFLMPQGLTGLWQVTARANSTFGEALEMDVAYVRGWSIGLDLRLLVRTPFQLMRQRGATA